MKVLKKLKKLKWKLKWKYECIIELGKQPKINADILPNGKKMILIPHADDEWIGCSQIIKNESDCILLNMNMSGNDGEKLHEERYRELLSISRKFNLNLQTIDSSKIEDLKKIIKKEKPVYICLPYCIDWHNEHIQVMNILENTFEEELKDINIIMYQVSLPIIFKNITHYLPMSKKSWKDKWSTFSNVYKTQKEFPSYRFAMNERINGKMVNCFATEVFVVKQFEEWRKNYHKYLLSKEERKSIKESLSSIRNVRKILNNKDGF